MDLIDDPAPGENAHEYTVSEISGAVKRVIEAEFGRVRIKGELGRVTIARSGHIYTDLKDDRAVLSSVIWKGQAARLGAVGTHSHLNILPGCHTPGENLPLPCVRLRGGWGLVLADLPGIADW